MWNIFVHNSRFNRCEFVQNSRCNRCEYVFFLTNSWFGLLEISMYSFSPYHYGSYAKAALIKAQPTLHAIVGRLAQPSC